uniref:Glutathione S-transferase kappa n=1 Tax=Panagrolaimus sp. PS1159 TaxID=55785 RepID=A0AC35FTZ9_9BILA
MANNSRPIINFYFDVISQYSFIGFESILQYEKRLPAKINFIPFFLGATIVETKNRPNIACPAKLPYMKQDIQIVSRYWGLTMKWPNNFEERIFKLGSIKPQRFLTALKQENPSFLVPAAREFASRSWSFDLPIHKEENIREVCSKLKIPNSEKLIEFSKNDEIKKEYQRATEEAIESGAFGAPWIILKQDGKEDLKFWGSDRLPYICNELGVDFKGALKN